MGGLGATLHRVEAVVGERLDGAVVAHHRRRLRRIGQLGALEGRPDAGSLPTRAGNEVEVLVDGEEVVPRIADAIAGARSHVELAGWHFEPQFQLGERGRTLRELLAGAAERVDVRVLAWAGSPLPLFTPDRKAVRESMRALASGTRVRVGLDAHERPMHCHHEKLVVVDGQTAFVGGVDLTSLAGDRFDRSDHPARGSLGWHDAAVQLRGPIVADVSAHFRLRWAEVTGETLSAPEPPPPAGGLDAQLVRTVPERVYGRLPRGDFGIVAGYVEALRSAERLIYLESQFLWSPEIVDVLDAKLRRPPSGTFRLLVLLPSKPNNGNDDSRGQVGQLVEADGGAGRFLACTLYQRGSRPATPVYVHAKVGIVDDRWLTIGSANLNEHSLFNDTEANVVLRDPELVRATRLRLWAEHLECAEAELAGDPAAIVDERWRPLAEAGLERRLRGETVTHRLARLPHVSRRSARLLGPLNGLLVDG